VAGHRHVESVRPSSSAAVPPGLPAPPEHMIVADDHLRQLDRSRGTCKTPPPRELQCEPSLIVRTLPLIQALHRSSAAAAPPVPERSAPPFGWGSNHYALPVAPAPRRPADNCRWARRTPSNALP
jgi:hypothetical protein